MPSYRVLVVDDSAFMRRLICDLISKDSRFSIVATAASGKDAIEALHVHKPDVITMDLEMPELNGLEALRHIMRHRPTPVIMLSGISEDNTRDTIKALSLGAIDFIRKPSSSVSVEQLGGQLLEKLLIAAQAKRRPTLLELRSLQPPSAPTVPRLPRPLLPGKIKEQVKATAAEASKPLADEAAGAAERARPSGNSVPKETKSQQEMAQLAKKQPVKLQPPQPLRVQSPSAPTVPLQVVKQQAVKQQAVKQQAVFEHLILIGTSTGGPRALHQVLASLPANLPAPVLVVQHMPPRFTQSLAQRLDSFCHLQVVEASAGERIVSGKVYIAPGGKHMRLGKDQQGYYIQLNTDEPRNGHRPSVDVLFESALPFRALRRHAVIMTGMGSDGAKAMKLLAEQGLATAIAEAEETCVVYGMPRAAVEAGAVQKAVPVHQIATELARAVLKA